jgi:uncharacterized membrane protein
MPHACSLPGVELEPTSMMWTAHIVSAEEALLLHTESVNSRRLLVYPILVNVWVFVHCIVGLTGFHAKRACIPTKPQNKYVAIDFSAGQ